MFLECLLHSESVNFKNNLSLLINKDFFNSIMICWYACMVNVIRSYPFTSGEKKININVKTNNLKH